MRRILDVPLLVILMGIGALAMYVPAAHALMLSDYAVARPFFYGGTVLLIFTVMIGIATAGFQPRNMARSHLAALFGAYLVLPVMLALPFHQAVRDTTLLNAWFEMISSFTTTGATLFDAEGRLPPSLHLWRALVGWLGGFFVLVTAVAILAPLSLGGMEVITGQTPGRGAVGAAQITRIADPSQRLTRYARALLPAYGGLTLALWVLLLVAGEDGLTALCHAMGTLSTSGITVVTGPDAPSAGIAGEMLIFLFLALAISRRALPGAVMVDRATPFHADPEVRMAAAVLAGGALVLFLRHWLVVADAAAARDLATAGHALWGALFTTLSFLTTTGYESADWATVRGWSGLGAPGLMLMGLALIGGGVATTAGGVKLLRVYALFRHAQRELERIVHPRSVGGEGVTERRLRGPGAYVAWIFFMLFAFSIAIVTAALALVGIGFEPALVLAIAALSTTGPLAAVAAEAPVVWADLGSAAKIILGAAMILGRMETLAILALLAPDGWRK